MIEPRYTIPAWMAEEDAEDTAPVLRPPCDHEDNTNRLHRPCCGDRFMCGRDKIPTTGKRCAVCNDWEAVTEAPVLAE